MKEARKKRKEKKTLFLTGVPRPADEAGRLGAGLEQPLQSLPDLVHDGEEGRVHVAEERERWWCLVVWGGKERKGKERVREEEEVERGSKKKEIGFFLLMAISKIAALSLPRLYYFLCFFAQMP